MKKNILIIENSHPSSIEKCFIFRKLEIKYNFRSYFILGCIKKIKYILNFKIITLKVINYL